MSISQRGMFDGENPPSTTFIFDGNIFDTILGAAEDRIVLDMFVHSNEEQTVGFHGTAEITVK